MILKPEDRATLQLIFEEFLSLIAIHKIFPVHGALAKLKQKNIPFENEKKFIDFVNESIRMPLYTFFISEEERKKCDLMQRNSIYNILMVLAIYWPLNTNCCISHPNDNSAVNRIPRINHAVLLSGHVADKTTLLNFWEANKRYKHPVDHHTISTREVLWIFPHGKLSDYEKLDSTPYTKSPSAIKRGMKARLENNVNFIFMGLGVGLSMLAAGLLLNTLPFALLFCMPFSISYVALMANLLLFSAIVGMVSANFLKKGICNLVVEYLYKEVDNFQIEMNRILFEVAKTRNYSTEVFLKLITNVRNNIIANQQLISNTAQPTPVAPAQAPISRITAIDRASPPTTDWRKVGLHAVSTSPQSSQQAEVKLDSEGDMSPLDLNRRQRIS